MSYLNQAHDPRRRAKALIAVGAIHAVLAYGLVTGLGVELIERLAPPPLEGEQIPITPPPPEPTPPRPDERIIETPVAPKPPIDMTQPSEVVVAPIEDVVAVSDDIVTDVRPVLPPPPPPRPSFTPKRAEPRNAGNWIADSDYPRAALVAGAEGSVSFRLAIAVDGRVADCELTRPTGNRALDDATCRLITRRARFEPATDEAGAKVAGTYAGSVTWQIPD